MREGGREGGREGRRGVGRKKYCMQLHNHMCTQCTSGPLYFTTSSACIPSPTVQVYPPAAPPPPSPLKWMATNSNRGSQFTSFWYAVEKVVPRSYDSHVTVIHVQVKLSCDPM